MSVSRETKIDAYIALLLKWGSTINLTSTRQTNEPALRELMSDCLCVVPSLPPLLGRIIDLGSGQGFPAIPIAIETGITIDLIEADRRKAAFLTTAMAALGIAGTVHATRIEAATVAKADCVTARALAPVASLVRLAKPFMTERGCCLFLKGPGAAAEIADMAGDPRLRVELFPTTRPPSTLVKVTALG